MTPKMEVKVGEKVKVGDVVFHEKTNDLIKFVSPVSGEIKEIQRGAKRRILSVKITADDKDIFKDFGSKTPGNLAGPQVKEALLEGGCWPMIKQRPYDIIANPAVEPKAIFISAVSTAPLAASHEFALHGREKEFQAGIDALSKLTAGKVHLSVQGIAGSFLNDIKGVVLHKVSGKHPAGNVGVQIAKVDPINAGEKVWCVHPQDVASIGNFFLTGKYDPSRVIALAGSQVENPEYYSVIRGAMIEDLIVGKLREGKNRVISGDPLTGTSLKRKDALGFYHDTITVLPEGDYYTFFGWVPFTGNKKFSVSRTFLSWLAPNKEYELDFHPILVDVTEVMVMSNKAFKLKAKLTKENGGICRCCGRTLTDEMSQVTGIGPVCAKYVGVEHPKSKDDVEQFKVDISNKIDEIGEFEFWIPKRAIVEWNGTAGVMMRW